MTTTNEINCARGKKEEKIHLIARADFYFPKCKSPRVWNSRLIVRTARDTRDLRAHDLRAAPKRYITGITYIPTPGMKTDLRRTRKRDIESVTCRIAESLIERRRRRRHLSRWCTRCVRPHHAKEKYTEGKERGRLLSSGAHDYTASGMREMPCVAARICQGPGMSVDGIPPVDNFPRREKRIPTRRGDAACIRTYAQFKTHVIFKWQMHSSHQILAFLPPSVRI